MGLRRSVFGKSGLLSKIFLSLMNRYLSVKDAGYRVLLWNGIAAYLQLTPQGRDEQRTHRLHARNECCSIVMRAPLLLIAPLAAGRLISQFRYASARGVWRLIREPRIWCEFFVELPRAIYHRRPVCEGTVKISLLVNHHKTVASDDAWRLSTLSSPSVVRQLKNRRFSSCNYG